MSLHHTNSTIVNVALRQLLQDVVSGDESRLQAATAELRRRLGNGQFSVTAPVVMQAPHVDGNGVTIGWRYREPWDRLSDADQNDTREIIARHLRQLADDIEEGLQP